MYEPHVVGWVSQGDKPAPEGSEDILMKTEPQFKIDESGLVNKKAQTARKKKHRKNMYQCDECKKVFRDTWQRERHSAVHSVTKSQKPEDNSYQPVDQPQILRLEPLEERPTPEMSEVKLMKNKPQLHKDNAGMEKVKAKNIKKKIQRKKKSQCSECNKMFRDSFDLKRHSKVHFMTQTKVHGKKKERELPKIDADLTNSKSHGTSKKIPGRKAAQCEECKKMFRDTWKLRRHSTVHTGIKAFKCALCEKSYTCKESLIKHMRASHIEILM